MTDNKRELNYEEFMVKALTSLKEVISTIDSKIDVMQNEFNMGYQEPIYLKTNLVISRDSFVRISDQIILALDTLIDKEKETTKEVIKEEVKVEAKPEPVKEKPKKPTPSYEEFEDDEEDFKFDV